jgi:transcriptional regulator with XRE-family HTH domain
MVTGMQIMAARHALRWTALELADRAGLSVSTIKRIEVSDGVPSVNASNLVAVQSALESAGIEFIGTAADGPGLRMRTPQAQP